MNKTWDIPGGIHPPENKLQSLKQGIAEVPLPDILILPLNQHIGAPAMPVVKPGDTVLKGQLVAEPNGFVSAAVHAPSSGAIEAIEDRAIPHPSAMDASCIVIRTDGEDRWVDLHPNRDYRALTIRQLLNLVRDAGITGMGGAGFPSAVKLQPRQSIGTLIINATECEPYITADDGLIRERADEIVIGIDILAQILGNPQQILIGIENNKPEAYTALVNACESAAKNGAITSSIEVVSFATKYPSGGEKQLIQILTGQEVPSGKLPAELGIVCHNIGTVYAVFRAVYLGEPLISRITTVTGNSCTKPGNYEVLLGTPTNHLLGTAGFDEVLCQRLIMGGPMMGYTLNDLNAPVIKSTNCLLAADIVESPAGNPAQACIRCGHCSEVCPASLLPQQLYWYAKARDYDQLANHHLADCIECGACSYVCPSEIPLVQYYRAAKGEIRLIEQEVIVSDRARQRFEYHQERLTKAEQDRTAKREARREEARKKAAELAKNNSESSSADESDVNVDSEVIQAALARVSATKNSPEQELKRLERAVTAAENRLAKAEEKLRQCPDDDSRKKVLEAAVAQTRLRHDDAVNKLSRFKIADIASEQTQSANASAKLADDPTDKDQLASDRASLAIKNAQLKAARQADMSELEKLQNQHDSLQKRVEKARNRLEQAISDNDDNIDAYRVAVEKLDIKLNNSETAIANFVPDDRTSDTLHIEDSEQHN